MAERSYMPVKICISDSDILLELLLLVVERNVVAIFKNWAASRLLLAFDLVFGLLDHSHSLLVELNVRRIRHSFVHVVTDLDIECI